MRGVIPTAPEIRFWRFVPKGNADDCWIWRGAKNNKGYGTFSYGKDHTTGKHVTGLAHRFSYAMLVGPIPDGMFLCHTCDTPACVNPGHLFIGDQFANMRDLRDKGRHCYAKRNHCSKGHDYAVSGFYEGRNGSRVCRVCAGARVARYKAKKLAAQNGVAE